MNKKVIIGMSGGVDSCMALVLLKKQGYQPTGVTLKYSVWDHPANKSRENVCCTTESRQIAKEICRRYDCEHVEIDTTKEFNQITVGYFIRELKAGRTPNPCVICNHQLKFAKLLEIADQNGIEWVATGHYARVEGVKQAVVQPILTRRVGNLKPDGLKNRPSQVVLKIAKDTNKDQTYSLAFLTQGQLQRCIFPLGEYTKQQVYQLAKKEGLTELVTRKESQDFCFVSGNAIREFLKQEIGENPGDVIDTKGNKLGTHQGLHFYTLGQKRGLELPVPIPYYVVKKNMETNTLIVSSSPDDPLLLSKVAILDPVNFINPHAPPIPQPDGSRNPDPSGFPWRGLKVQVRTRYREKLVNSKVRIQKSEYILEFEKPHRAVTPGQYAVFYQGDTCLGGGRIVTV